MDLIPFALGACFNLAVALLIVRGIYYPRTPDRNYIFSFLAFNTVIYFVLSLLTSVEMSVGIGFGLFAIFSVLRYRTEETPIREMTYLFVLIALPVVNAVLMPMGNVVQLLLANGAVAALLFVLEQGWGFRFEAQSRVVYDRIELIVPERRGELIADLCTRTGLPISRVSIGRIDLRRDSADVTVYYDPAALESLVAPQPASVQEYPITVRPTLES